MEFLFILFLSLMIGIPLADMSGAQRNAAFGESLSYLLLFTALGLIVFHIMGFGHMAIFGPVTVPSGFGQ